MTFAFQGDLLKIVNPLSNQYEIKEETGLTIYEPPACEKCQAVILKMSATSVFSLQDQSFWRAGFIRREGEVFWTNREDFDSYSLAGPS